MMDTFVFHKEWLDYIADLSEEEQGRIILAVSRQAFDGEINMNELTAAGKVALRAIMASIANDRRSASSGRKGGRPRKNSTFGEEINHKNSQKPPFSNNENSENPPFEKSETLETPLSEVYENEKPPFSERDRKSVV